jgi:hypothetical protein
VNTASAAVGAQAEKLRHTVESFLKEVAAA